jgi:hypothetical protein
MTHFLKKHWVVLAAFALSFLLTIFISPENAVIAETTSTAKISDRTNYSNHDSALNEGRRKKEEGRRKKEEVRLYMGIPTPTQNKRYLWGRGFNPQNLIKNQFKIADNLDKAAPINFEF